MKETTKHFLGDILLLLVALIWGMGFIAVKIGLNNGVSTYFLLFSRFSVAGLLIIPFVFTKIRHITKKTFFIGLLLGVFMFLGFTFQTLGLSLTTTSKNAFLTGVNVIMVPYVTFVLTKKKVSYTSIFAAFLTLVGIGFLTLNDSLNINSGDLLTLVCAVMFAFHISVTSIVAKNESALVLVFLQMWTSAILSLVVSLFLKETWVLDASSTLAILYLGAFSTLLAFLLQTIGQRYAHASKAAILLSLESLFGAFFAVLIFGDTFNMRMVIGALIIFIGIYISEAGIPFTAKSLTT
jgi:drug/metabolite transporter (DMT)-like permease